MERKPDPLKKKVLGRGLSALLPGPAERDTEFLRIPVDQIRTSPFQPRRTFSPDDLRELVDSLREKGVLQPLLVRQTAGGYELVAGERRLRAAQAAGLETVPAVVRKLSDREALEATIVENVQRADLNAIELAEGFHRLAHEFSLSQEDISRRVGKDRVTVANTMRLLKLPAQVKQAVVEGKLSGGHARALLAAPPEKILEIFATAVRKGLSVREVEELCKNAGKRRHVRKTARHDPHLRDLEEKLSRRGGTKVRIRGTQKKGVIEVAYFSDGEFLRLCELLFGGR
ncbi:MAG: ParB/RepB/Spo0J family partition protein [Deltaproteobacteria bacterium]|nr:ParB/RepB/Spo0J family partition protein [Deltaproteobacteria bacterium]